jgi:hypothetical protein
VRIRRYQVPLSSVGLGTSRSSDADAGCTNDDAKQTHAQNIQMNRPMGLCYIYRLK